MELQSVLNISDCKSLTKLKINYLSNQDLISFNDGSIFPHLIHLCLKHNGSFNQPLNFRNFPNLQKFDIGWCESYNIPITFDDNSKLETILMPHCSSFEKNVDVSQCSHLKQLDTKGTLLPLIKFHPKQSIEKVWCHQYHPNEEKQNLLKFYKKYIHFIDQSTIKIVF